ncbi:peptidoglycan-binding protein [Candidatus Kaiserbacteria bacterium]|nr:peptidoglycan-binding protein [Candidatus Kaiserbacteria bacterium]
MNNLLMRKCVISSLITAVLLTAVPAFAQVYYPNYASSATCTMLTRDLSVGLRNSEVLTLQRFLVAQNYPGGGNWMLTGYFGRATEQAVRNFQQQVGIYMTGIVDVATRSAIQNASCGGYTYPNYNYNYNNTYPYTNYTYPTYPNYSGCQYYNCQSQSDALSITYVTPNSGAVGSVVTVYGYGFSTEGNAVHLGNGIIANLSSFDGRSLSFTVPAQLSGYGTQMTQLMTYNLYVTNQLGQNSNVTQFIVTSLTGSGTSQGLVTLNTLSPGQGQKGTQIQLIGSGFSANDNSVHFGIGGLRNVSSVNGTTIYYTIPQYVSTCDLIVGSGCAAPATKVVAGSYAVYVTNGNGSTQALNFTVIQ